MLTGTFSQLLQEIAGQLCVLAGRAVEDAVAAVVVVIIVSIFGRGTIATTGLLCFFLVSAVMCLFLYERFSCWSGVKRAVVSVGVGTVRLSTARTLGSCVIGGIDHLRQGVRNMSTVSIRLGLIGGRTIGGGAIIVSFPCLNSALHIRGAYGAFRRTISGYVSVIGKRVRGIGSGMET